MHRDHFSVNGIANETMKTSLKNSLEKIEGVNNVCVDMARGTVEVIHNDISSCEEIKSCIEKAGYIIE